MVRTKGAYLNGVAKIAVVIAVLFLLAFTSLSFSQPVFGPPVNLGPQINSPYPESDPFLTADGKKLFFVSDRPGGYGQEDIWYSVWNGTSWSAPIILGPQINSARREKSPSVSPDGQKLYYVDTERDGTYWDIWVSTWDSSVNNWGVPQNLGYPVNTIGVEFSARIGPDGLKLYFTSEYCCDSLFPDGRCGFYVSEWDGANWSIPQFFGGGHCAISGYPSVSANGLWLYYDEFVSDGISILLRSWKGFNWGSPIDLRPELGGRAVSPFINPSGESLFFAGSTDLGGFGATDIWMARRLPPGDLNLDSQLSAADVVLELNKVFLNEPYPAPERLGDLNCDTIFSPADVVLILRRVFGIISSLDCSTGHLSFDKPGFAFKFTPKGTGAIG